MADLHHVKVVCLQPGAYGCRVELDGRPLMCSRLEFSADARTPYPVVRITLPAANVEFEGDAEVSVELEVPSPACRPA